MHDAAEVTDSVAWVLVSLWGSTWIIRVTLTIVNQGIRLPLLFGCTILIVSHIVYDELPIVSHIDFHTYNPQNMRMFGRCRGICVLIDALDELAKQQKQTTETCMRVLAVLGRG